MPAAAADGIELVPLKESRWPPAAAVFLYLVLNIAMRILLFPRSGSLPFRGSFRHLKPPCSGCWCSAARPTWPGTDAGCTPPLSRWQP